MPISRLKITNFRNLADVDMDFSPDFNVIFGNNGSGKTSILEAIYYLGRGRSFRTKHCKRIIKYEQESFILNCGLKKSSIDNNLGILRDAQGNKLMKVDGETVNTAAKLAELLPIQLINPDSYQILDSGPKIRRQFIDWGLFHVEHCFLSVWQQYNRLIKQRNSLLKQHSPADLLKSWDAQLQEVANELDKLRFSYFDLLIPIFGKTLSLLLEHTDISLNYYRGWSSQFTTYTEALVKSMDKDRERGFTQVGPHRADLKIMSGDVPAIDKLSRGQQKLLICALKLAQGVILHQQSNKRCLFLFDDLPSELDKMSRIKIFDFLVKLGAQVVVTGVYQEDFLEVSELPEVKMFHVEHGNVNLWYNIPQ